MAKNKDSKVTENEVDQGGKANLQVLDKNSWIGQNPWVCDKIFGSFDKFLVFGKIKIKQLKLRGGGDSD